MSEGLQYHKSGLFFASLADAYIEKGMIEDAIKILKEATTLHPDLTYGHRLLGICYFKTNDFARAEQELKLALKDDNDLKARYYLALTFLATDRIEDARGILNEMIRITPECSEAEEIRKEIARRTRGEEVEEEALDVTPLLKELVSLPAIDGVILLEKDGLTIASEGVEESEELAAIISGIANQSLTTGSEFNIGDLESFTVITPHRRFINIVGPDAILTLISGPDGGEGLATLYGTKIHSRIISILGR